MAYRTIISVSIVELRDLVAYCITELTQYSLPTDE